MDWTISLHYVIIYIRFLLNAKEREIDEAAKASEKIGGGVRFGGNDIRVIEGDNDSDDGGSYDDEDQVVIGDVLDMNDLGVEEI